jgi:hypothetical protein
MIAGNIDYIFELERAPLQEITEASNSLHLTAKVCQCSVAVRIKVSGRVVVQILSNHNVATQNQYIGTFVIVDVTIRKFQM